MTKEYKIPKETQEVFLDYTAATECMDEAIKKVFGWKRAAHFSKSARKHKREFLRQVSEIYPELAGVDVIYDENKGVVIRDE